MREPLKAGLARAERGHPAARPTAGAPTPSCCRARRPPGADRPPGSRPPRRPPARRWASPASASRGRSSAPCRRPAANWPTSRPSPTTPPMTSATLRAPGRARRPVRRRPGHHREGLGAPAARLARRGSRPGRSSAVFEDERGAGRPAGESRARSRSRRPSWRTSSWSGRASTRVGHVRRRAGWLAVPSRTRPTMPCRMPARRKAL